MMYDDLPIKMVIFHSYVSWPEGETPLDPIKPPLNPIKSH